MRPLIYLAAPYSDPCKIVVEERVRRIGMVAAHLTKQYNFHVFSPISHWHTIATQFDLPTDADYWKEYDIAMLDRCNLLLVLLLNGYSESPGVTRECDHAWEKGKEIQYLNEYFPHFHCENHSFIRIDSTSFCCRCGATETPP